MGTGRPEIQIDRDKKGNVVRVRGELTYYYMGELRDLLKTGLERDPRRNFVFDLEDCTFVDSGCMGIMVEFKKELDKRGGDMKIINVAGYVEEAMKRIGMGTIVPIVRKQ